MALKPARNVKVRKPKKQKVKQGHKLVWLTLVVILLPLCIIGYQLLVSAQTSDEPVPGSRFEENALANRISSSQISDIQNQLMNIEGVESASASLKSATLRIHLNMNDSYSDEQLTAAAEQAYNIVNDVLPINEYFTNADGVKNYDLEIDAYTYIIDDSHPADGQRFIKIVKTGAGEKIIDNLTSARNPELADQVKNFGQAAQPAEEQPAPVQDIYIDEYGNYFIIDEAGNYIYTDANGNPLQ